MGLCAGTPGSVSLANRTDPARHGVAVFTTRGFTVYDASGSRVYDRRVDPDSDTCDSLGVEFRLRELRYRGAFRVVDLLDSLKIEAELYAQEHQRDYPRTPPAIHMTVNDAQFLDGPGDGGLVAGPRVARVRFIDQWDRYVGMLRDQREATHKSTNPIDFPFTPHSPHVSPHNSPPASPPDSSPYPEFKFASQPSSPHQPPSASPPLPPPTAHRVTLPVCSPLKPYQDDPLAAADWEARRSYGPHVPRTPPRRFSYS